MPSAIPTAIGTQPSGLWLGSVLNVFGLRVSAGKSRVLHEGIWVAVGQGIAAIGMVAGMRLLTEAVPPTVFGAVTLLLAIAPLAYNFLCSPLLLAGTRFY